MTEWLQALAESPEAPWLSALALGLLTAISPCPLATNITATAYIARGFKEKRLVLWSGILYTLGRGLSYTSVAVALFYGANEFNLARFLQGNGEKFLGPVLIFIGLIMLGAIPLKYKGSSALARVAESLGKRGLTGAFFLGVLFALAFCPYSGVLFFGMLVPLTVRSSDAFSIPMLFALGTGIPVMLFTYLLAFSMEKISSWFNAIQKAERVVRYLAGSVFILVGIYYVLMFAGWIS